MYFQGPFWGRLTLVPLIASGVLALLLLITAILLRKRTIQLRIPARVESIRWLTGLVDEMAREVKLSEQVIFQCRLALDEACANIINHSYPESATGEIDVFIQADRGGCMIRLTDFGEPYDPAVVSTPVPARSIDDVHPGGLGLHLIRSVMDEVRYTPGPDGNRLLMVKYDRRQPATS